jgi:hypothetical protein
VAVTCQEFVRLLDADGVASSAEALTHAASCPACGHALERWQATQRELRAMGEEPVPEYLAVRVMARLRSERQDVARRVQLTSPWRRLRLLPAAAMLAVVASGSVAVWHLLHGGGAPLEEPRPAPPTATTRETAQPPRTKAERVAPAAPPARKLREQRPDTPLAAQHQRQAAAPAPADRTLSLQLAAPPPAAGAATRDEAPRDAGGVVGGAFAPAPAAEPQAKADGRAGAAANQPAAAPAEAPRALVLREEAPVGTVVSVQPVAGGKAVVVLLAPDDTPRPGETWLADVMANGRITLSDAAGRDLAAAHPNAIALLRAAGLKPGPYLLHR